MVKGNHLQVWDHPLLFFSYKWFNIKAALAHCCGIQKELDELLAIGGAGFLTNVFVVLNHTDGLCPICKLKQFNYCVHIHTFKMPTIKQVWHLIQQDDILSLLISRTLIYIFLLLRIILVALAKWSAQTIQLDCGVITVVGIIIWHCHHHLGLSVYSDLATSLMGATSYMAYILEYFPHKWTSSNLGMWHVWGIFVGGTYMVATQ